MVELACWAFFFFTFFFFFLPFTPTPPPPFLTPELGTGLYTYFSLLGHFWGVTPGPLKRAWELPWSLPRPLRAKQLCMQLRFETPCASSPRPSSKRPGVAEVLLWLFFPSFWLFLFFWCCLQIEFLSILIPCPKPRGMDRFSPLHLLPLPSFPQPQTFPKPQLRAWTVQKLLNQDPAPGDARADAKRRN